MTVGHISSLDAQRDATARASAPDVLSVDARSVAAMMVTRPGPLTIP
jgi:hypothetical protein